MNKLRKMVEDYLPLNEGKKMDTITMDIPLFIRMLEFAKEDAKSDMALHRLTEKATDLSSNGKILTMSDYDTLVKNNK